MSGVLEAAATHIGTSDSLSIKDQTAIGSGVIKTGGEDVTPTGKTKKFDLKQIA